MTFNSLICKALSCATPLVIASLSLSSPAALAAPDNALPNADSHGALLVPDTDAEARLALPELRTFVSVFNHIRNSYVEAVDDRTIMENAIRGMLSELDPHSNYLEPETFGDLQVSATGEFGGLGLEVGMENGFVKVIAPIDDTPAQRAGIEAGDLIIKIDNQPVKGMSLNEAVRLMRGPKGSDIALSIVREGIPQPFDIVITRDAIAVVSVRSRVLEDGYGYLRIAQFQANTGAEVIKALRKLEGQAALKGVVLDLRNNPGGVLQAAIEVSDAFLDGGLVVYTEGRLSDAQSRYEASSGDVTNNAPLVVLINPGSASASEIVAGALQDHKRAIILGTTSFGKGSVQTVIPLSATHGMKLTTALYYTPNGRSIQAQGIVPDIVVERGKITKIESRARISESDLPRHLKNGRGKKPLGNEAGAASETVSSDVLSNDTQLHEALTLLKGLHILSAQTVTPVADNKIERSKS